MTNLGKFSNNIQAIKQYENWYKYNYVSPKAIRKLNAEITRLKKENEFLVKEGLNQTSKIEITTKQFNSEINGKNKTKINIRPADYR